MSEAVDTYIKIREGKLSRFPLGFWNPPEGFTRMIEIIRYASEQAGIHPAYITRDQLKSWGLETPLVQLCNGSTSKLRQLASVGFADPPHQAENPGLKRQRANLTNAVMSEVWIRDQGKCTNCGSLEDLEFDHVIPFSKGGSSTSENLRILCRHCNRKRGSKI